MNAAEASPADESSADAVNAAAQMLGVRAERSVQLASFTTFRIGGAADLLVRAETMVDLQPVADAVAATGIDVLVIGQGSNLLIADAGWRGLVVVLGGSEFDQIEVRSHADGVVVHAGAGVKLPVLARRSVAEGLTGLEWMVGVPGSVGGAVRMNAGGHGSDVAANLVDVDIVNMLDGLGCVTRSADELGFSYRHSALTAGDIVVRASFGIGRADVVSGEDELREIVRWRRANQPGGANCGSVFTNPPGDSAGRLIDATGLKGHRLGTASVSDKHANFIQADPNGSAVDVWHLILLVRDRVFTETGIILTPEVRTAGFDATLPELPSAESSASQPEPTSP